MVKKSKMMRVDPDFHSMCINLGIATKVTKKLAKERTILSEMISDDEFKKQMEEFYKRFKGFDL